jgi:hypothetical protein
LVIAFIIWIVSAIVGVLLPTVTWTNLFLFLSVPSEIKIEFSEYVIKMDVEALTFGLFAIALRKKVWKKNYAH